jgi:hypothetical protein
MLTIDPAVLIKLAAQLDHALNPHPDGAMHLYDAIVAARNALLEIARS